MTDSPQDPLLQIYSGEEGFRNEARLNERINKNLSRRLRYWIVLFGIAMGLIGVGSLIIQLFLPMAGLNPPVPASSLAFMSLSSVTGISTGLFVLARYCIEPHKRKRIVADSCCLVQQRHKNAHPLEKYDPAKTFGEAIAFLFDHPNVSLKLFRQLEKLAIRSEQEYKNRVQQHKIHESMDYARKVLRLTVKRATRAHGNAQQRCIVNSNTNHRDMLIELARGADGLSAINRLRHVMGWDRAR
jgi:hypothetical protein